MDAKSLALKVLAKNKAVNCPSLHCLLTGGAVYTPQQGKPTPIPCVYCGEIQPSRVVYARHLDRCAQKP